MSYYWPDSRSLVSGTIIITVSSVKLLLGYPMATPSHEDPLNIVPWDQFFHKLQQLLDRIDVRVAQLQAKLWVCGVIELVSLDH